MSAQIVPLDNSAQQNLAVALNVDGLVLRLRLSIAYSEMAGYWVMAIADAAGNLLLASVPMITGNWPAANLLAQYGYLRIGSAYIINAGQISADYPNAIELGNSFVLLWDDTAP